MGPTMTMTVSAGHAEYLPPPVPGVEMDVVWDAAEADLGDRHVVMTPEMWVQIAGSEPMPDADFDWEVIVRFTGARAALLAALDGLIDYIASTPGGNDDTFDYWPSGVRLALAMNERLDTPRTDEILEAVYSAIVGTGFEAELFDKCGVPAPKEES